VFSGADAEHAGIYLHARYFDPQLGTFPSPDPLDPTLPGVGANRDGYAFGNPINATDRTGLRTVCVPWGQILNREADKLETACLMYGTVDSEDTPGGRPRPARPRKTRESPNVSVFRS
jgi:RHS repeat-associated protein